MKEKNTEKRTVYGLAEDHWMPQGHSQQEAGGLGPILNSAMNTFYGFGPIISFSQASVFL